MERSALEIHGLGSKMEVFLKEGENSHSCYSILKLIMFQIILCNMRDFGYLGSLIMYHMLYVEASILEIRLQQLSVRCISLSFPLFFFSAVDQY